GRPTSGGRTCGPQVAPPSRSRTGTGQWWTTALVCRRRTRLGAGLLKPARSGCQSPARQGVAVRLRGGPAAAGRASRGRRWPRRRRRRGERGAATGSWLLSEGCADLVVAEDAAGVVCDQLPHAGDGGLGRVELLVEGVECVVGDGVDGVAAGQAASLLGASGWVRASGGRVQSGAGGAPSRVCQNWQQGRGGWGGRAAWGAALPGGWRVDGTRGLEAAVAAGGTPRRAAAAGGPGGGEGGWWGGRGRGVPGVVRGGGRQVRGVGRAGLMGFSGSGGGWGCGGGRSGGGRGRRWRGARW